MTKGELLRLVRSKCLECCGGSIKEMQECPITGCSLYQVRYGKDPTKRTLSPEEKKTLAQRLTQARKKINLTQSCSSNSQNGVSGG